MVKRQVPYSDAYALLGAIYVKQGKPDKAVEIYQAATKNRRLPEQERKSFETMITRLR